MGSLSNVCDFLCAIVLAVRQQPQRAPMSSLRFARSGFGPVAVVASLTVGLAWATARPARRNRPSPARPRRGEEGVSRRSGRPGAEEDWGAVRRCCARRNSRRTAKRSPTASIAGTNGRANVDGREEPCDSSRTRPRSQGTEDPFSNRGRSLGLCSRPDHPGLHERHRLEAERQGAVTVIRPCASMRCC